MRAGFEAETTELDGLFRELHRNQDEIAGLHALHGNGLRTTGTKELDNAYSAMAQNSDVFGPSCRAGTHPPNSRDRCRTATRLPRSRTRP